MLLPNIEHSSGLNYLGLPREAMVKLLSVIVVRRTLSAIDATVYGPVVRFFKVKNRPERLWHDSFLVGIIIWSDID
jgi:hypothetical protein